ncbi:hypothetical protein [Nocardioides sp. InS609-2]|uniref:hypothetical protein n=1 Tax=Nocardioides sp. InS609-2 TaxID=2760705 RepID=UPI0020C010FB|nr:hypothetical protein [Nocardioides sp. InS609-2]
MNKNLPPNGPTAEQNAAAATTSAGTVDAAVNADKYHQMLALAELFDSSGEQMRTRARLGAEVLGDDDVSSSAPLSPATFAEAEDDIRAATTGKHGLLTRSVELDADALVVRATVLTYRWIDELQEAAYKTLGSIAGRAIGYLAPEVALGGAIVSAGLIETDALDRDGVAAYLSDLAENNPELMDHISGGGGLLDGLQMRSLLTAGVLTGDQGAMAARGGMRAMGIAPFSYDGGSALRDAAGGLLADDIAAEPVTSALESDKPRTIADLMTTLSTSDAGIVVQGVGAGRYIAYLPGPGGAGGTKLRLVSGDQSTYARQVVRTIEKAVGDDEDARVMLVGSAQGGATAAELAASATSDKFLIDHVVTAGAPQAQVPMIPETCRVLSLEDRADPVALLGSLINAKISNRLTVVFDGTVTGNESVYVAGGRAADASSHPELQAEIQRIREGGYLAG